MAKKRFGFMRILARTVIAKFFRTIDLVGISAVGLHKMYGFRYRERPATAVAVHEKFYSA
jgi:hypothetical protein